MELDLRKFLFDVMFFLVATVGAYYIAKLGREKGSKKEEKILTALAIAIQLIGMLPLATTLFKLLVQ